MLKRGYSSLIGLFIRKHKYTADAYGRIKILSEDALKIVTL